MISKISVEDRHFYNAHKTQNEQEPAFKGVGAALLTGIQACEKNPMINVAVIDMLSAILPRTFIESLTNWFAGFEAFRRESSGLIVNCMIPSFISLGFAAILNKFVMPEKVNMASCWADSSLIDKATNIYSKSNSQDKVKDSLKEILGNIEGFHGKNPVIYKEALTPQEIEKYTNKLLELSKSDLKNKELNKEIEKLTQEIVKKTHVFENVKVGNVKATTTATLLQDSVKFFREFQKAPKELSIQEFAKKSKRLVKSKSILGLAVVLPLAASMQYINRWITEKVSGVKGAPIYDDFGKEDSIRDNKAKEGLLKQKIISISSMIGVSLLSMMKMPTWNMFEFKGKFPTMDQARIISTTTFASRMAAADDKNELAESTKRDIATFMGLYFLGDYAGKATASAIQKKTGIQLLNETQKLKENANAFEKFWHWVKHTNIKSSEEVIGKKAVNMRSACQLANLGVSLVLLGIIVPIFTRKSTQKKHAEALRLARENSSTGVDNKPTHINGAA